VSHAVGPEALDDRSVLLVLQEISARLGEGLVADEGTVRTEDEARLLLAELLREYDVRDVDPSEIAANETDAQAMARRTLGLFTEDPSTAPVARAVVEDPPEDEQLVIETAILAAVVLAALVTWLQTKVHFSVKRADGKTSIEFSLDKDATDSATVKSIAESVAKLLP
jgi:hypothetical protein